MMVSKRIPSRTNPKAKNAGLFTMSSNETGNKCVEAEAYKANWSVHFRTESLQKERIGLYKVFFSFFIFKYPKRTLGVFLFLV